MNNPISDLYVKFLETIEPYIKKYPYLFGIIIGGIFSLELFLNGDGYVIVEVLLGL